VARTVTLQDIVTRARILSDQRDASFIQDSEALELLNEIYPELYDQLVSIDDNYYSTSTSFTVSAGTTDYNLPSDFYKSIGLDFSTDTGGNGSRVTLYPFDEAERNISFSTANSIPNGTVFLTYVPVAPTFTSLSQTVDGINGWDRLLSLKLAIDMQDAEERNSSRLQEKYDARLQQMMSSLERDIGMPSMVADVTRPSFEYMFSTMRYRFYGNVVRFMSTTYIGNPFNGSFV
jgi:hypothetical protein